VIDDLRAQGVPIMLVLSVGWPLRSRLQTLEATVTAQHTTIEAHAEPMQTLSAVLQDCERLNTVMSPCAIPDVIRQPSSVSKRTRRGSIARWPTS
jgi:hypothetical protein